MLIKLTVVDDVIGKKSTLWFNHTTITGADGNVAKRTLLTFTDRSRVTVEQTPEEINILIKAL